MIKSNLHEDNDDETERGVLLSVKALINEGNFAIIKIIFSNSKTEIFIWFNFLL